MLPNEIMPNEIKRDSKPQSARDAGFDGDPDLTDPSIPIDYETPTAGDALARENDACTRENDDSRLNQAIETD